MRKSGPTDVLSFPMKEQNLLGSVVIASDVAEKQARQKGHSLWDELKILVIHGVLHLLGYDHVKSREASRMQRKERELFRHVQNF